MTQRFAAETFNAFASWNSDLIKRVTGAAENVFHFVPHQFFYLGPGHGEVFSRIEFFR
jgi:hypothetical protein